MNYTHKSIFFTKENYKGDALVMMYPIKGAEKNHFDLNDFHYKTNGVDSFLQYQNLCGSLIVEKGTVQTVGNSSGYQYSGPYANDSAITGAAKLLTHVVFTDGSPHSGQLRKKPREGDPVKSDYTLTFYPRMNAFYISPAPLCELEDGRFRWVLHDEDTFTIDWDAEGVEHAYLEFFRHNELGEPINDRNRALPIEVKRRSDPEVKKDADAEVWIVPLPQYAIQRGETIKIVKKEDGAFWAFNFCCIINGTLFVVDPETRYGSGTHK